jgi:fibrillarin-like pre-rRNA processing protein
LARRSKKGKGSKRKGSVPKGIERSELSGVYVTSSSDGRGKQLFTYRNRIYRRWDPTRSKLSAYILKGAQELPFTWDSHVLYLGAASGTTAGHVADLCPDGMVYCVEVSKRSFRDLITACEPMPNMVPILGNARTPNTYAPLIGRVDIVYMDIAQRDQTSIFLKNIKAFLRPGKKANGLLMVKSRSIDVAKAPRKVFDKVLQDLSKEVEVLDSRPLEPFEKDHLAVLVRY